MKFLFYINIALLTVVCLVGCNISTPVDKVLALSDSLSERGRYDSVLTVLKSIEKEVPDLSEERKMHYVWNLSTAHYNMNMSMVGDSLLPLSVSYYRREKDVDKEKFAPLLEANYWNWNNNLTKVIQTVNTGLKEAERLNDNGLQVQLYYFMAQCYYEHRCYNKAVPLLRKAVSLSKKLSVDQQHPVIFLLAICYDLTGQKALSRILFQQAVEKARLAGNELMSVHYLRNYAASLNSDGQPDAALACLRKIYSSGKMYNGGIVMVMSEMANAFLLKHQLDSAQHYIELSKAVMNDRRYSVGLDPSVRCTVYSLEQLVQFGEGERPEMEPMGRYLDSIASDALRENSVMKQRLETEMNLLSRNSELVISRQRVLLYLFLSLAVIVGGALYVYRWIRERQRKRLDLEERIEALKRLVADAGRSDSHEKNQDNSFKKILLQQLGLLKVVASVPTAENQVMLSRLLSVPDNHKEADNSLLAWSDLYNAIDRLYNGFYSRLESEYGRILLEKEIQTLCLVRAGFSTKEIAVVTRQSTAMVYMRKTSIRKKLGIDLKGDILSFINSREGTETLC